MRYLLIVVLFFCHNGFGQTLGMFRSGDSLIKFVKVKTELIDTIKCKHIYVSVEPVKVQATWASIGCERKDLVCIKCFHQTKQEVISQGMPLATPPDTLKLWPNYSPQRIPQSAIGEDSTGGGVENILASRCRSSVKTG